MNKNIKQIIDRIDLLEERIDKTNQTLSSIETGLMWIFVVMLCPYIDRLFVFIKSLFI